MQSRRPAVCAAITLSHALWLTNKVDIPGNPADPTALHQRPAQRSQDGREYRADGPPKRGLLVIARADLRQRLRPGCPLSGLLRYASEGRRQRRWFHREGTAAAISGHIE